MTERLIDVPGGKIWTKVVGNGNGVPLLILHGGPGTPSVYLDGLGKLADSRPVVFYDQLGCGHSDRPAASEGFYIKDRFITEVDRVRDALGLSEVHLLGHSWGGLLAALYINDRPRGIRSVTFASPLISVSRWVDDCTKLKEKLPSEINDIIVRHEASGSTACPEYAVANFEWWRRHVCTITPFPEDLERSFSGTGTECYETMWGPSEFRCTGNLLGMDASAGLGKISCPVLFTCGRYDEATPESIGKFANLTSTSEFHVFEHSSHMAHLEEPDEYLGILRGFLSRADQIN